jgi:ABC-type multidrug transport system ATPase subunit
MAIDAQLLVLDEPTLGLDILYRKQFYDSLLNDYFDHRRTIVVTTHQVEEVQHVLTDLMFINRGRIVLSCTMEAFESRYRFGQPRVKHFRSFFFSPAGSSTSKRLSIRGRAPGPMAGKEKIKTGLPMVGCYS